MDWSQTNTNTNKKYHYCHVSFVYCRHEIGLIYTCPVGQLAKKSNSPSEKYHLSFLIIVKQGHSSRRTSSLKLNSSPRLLVVSDDRTGPISSHELMRSLQLSRLSSKRCTYLITTTLMSVVYFTNKQ